MVIQTFFDINMRRNKQLSLIFSRKLKKYHDRIRIDIHQRNEEFSVQTLVEEKRKFHDFAVEVQFIAAGSTGL